MTKVLFITKYREIEIWDGSDYSVQRYNSGVFLSAEFTSNMLNANGITTKLVKAIDNNCIDRLITENNPDVVILEAYWVVPEKFDELLPLHPNVKWIIHNHSAMPFIAEEGIIVDWTMRYIDYPNIYVGFNNKRTYEEFKFLAFAKGREERILFLPNYYPIELIKHDTKRPVYQNNYEVHVGCFGAIRPLKNNLAQAYASIKFAKEVNKKLFFHINSNETDSKNSPVVKNIKSLFEHTPEAELVIHEWMSHEEFYELCGTMDIGLQVSFSETFNIVAADLVANDVPVVGSNEIDFISNSQKADLANSNDIVKKMKKAINKRKHFSFFCSDDRLLEKYSLNSIQKWKMELAKFLRK